jgi:hypothetical protein
LSYIYTNLCTANEEKIQKSKKENNFIEHNFFIDWGAQKYFGSLCEITSWGIISVWTHVSSQGHTLWLRSRNLSLEVWQDDPLENHYQWAPFGQSCLMPAMQEAEIGRMKVWGQPRQKVSKTPPQSISWTWWHAPMIPATRLKDWGPSWAGQK